MNQVGPHGKDCGRTGFPTNLWIPSSRLSSDALICAEDYVASHIYKHTYLYLLLALVTAELSQWLSNEGNTRTLITRSNKVLEQLIHSKKNKEFTTKNDGITFRYAHISTLFQKGGHIWNELPSCLHIASSWFTSWSIPDACKLAFLQVEPNQRVCTRTTSSKFPPWMRKQSSKSVRLHLHHILQHGAIAPTAAENSPNTKATMKCLSCSTMLQCYAMFQAYSSTLVRGMKAFLMEE